MSTRDVSRTIRNLKRADEILHCIETDRDIESLRRECRQISETSTRSLIDSARHMRDRTAANEQNRIFFYQITGEF